MQDIILLMTRMMKQANLHHHYFGSLAETAAHLAFFILPHANGETRISTEDALKIITLSERRIAERIPVEYLTNQAIYSGNHFYVNEHVLIPRSVMSTRFQDFLNHLSFKNYRILDLCTGSGCIGITLALLNRNIQVDLADISEKALEVAYRNVAYYGLANRVHCIQSDLFKKISGRYDLIISNPPYVSEFEYEHVPDEFKAEPKLALAAGWDGLEIVHRIVKEAKNHLHPQGQLIMEVGYSSARRIKRRYGRKAFNWLPYRKPNGKVGFWAMDCILQCDAAMLQKASKKNSKETRFYRWLDWIRDFF